MKASVASWIVVVVILGFLEKVQSQDNGEPISYSGCQVYRLSVTNDKKYEVLKELQETGRLGLDFWAFPAQYRTSPTDVMACGANTAPFLFLLRANEIYYSVYIEDVKQEIQTELESNIQDFENGIIGTFATWSAINDYLESLASSRSDVASLEYIGNSTEGRTTRILKISKNDGKTRSGVFIEAGLHAREWVSPASVVYVIDMLVRFSYTGDSQDMLDRFDWYFLPVGNPDGYVYSHTENRLWRKNRRVNAGSACRGVDLNRNWESDFGGVGASDDPCNDLYRGMSAFSEHENRNIRDFINSKGRGYWKMYTSFHSYAQLWLMPYAYTSSVPADNDDLTSVAEVGADAIRKTHGKIYPVVNTYTRFQGSGSSMDWAKDGAGIKYSYTVELRNSGGFIVPVSEIIPTGQEVFNALRDVSAVIGPNAPLPSTQTPTFPPPAPRPTTTTTTRTQCFGPTSVVHFQDGTTKPVGSLRAGDRVLASDSSGNLIYSDMLTFLHYDNSTVVDFLKIQTEDGNLLTVSDNHLIFKGPLFDLSNAVFAEELQEGDRIFSEGSGKVQSTKIVSIARSIERGFYAPLTASGTIVVDGVVASCYATYPSHTASHLATSPLRWWISARNTWTEETPEDEQLLGIHPYADALHKHATMLGFLS